MSHDTILVERRDRVTLLTLNRPQALNALNSRLLTELLDATRALDADPGPGCAVILGADQGYYQVDGGSSGASSRGVTASASASSSASGGAGGG